MRIRAGFVSNSSSTSFLIITDGDLTLERFLKLVGVLPGSPMRHIFEMLFEAIKSNTWAQVDFSKGSDGGGLQNFKNQKKMNLSEKMLEKIEEAKTRGLKVAYGELSSEENPVETYFCIESFELEGNGIYLNALEATW